MRVTVCVFVCECECVYPPHVGARGTLSHMLSFMPSLSHTHTHIPACTHTHNTHTHNFSLTLSFTHTHTHTHALIPSLTNTLSRIGGHPQRRPVQIKCKNRESKGVGCACSMCHYRKASNRANTKHPCGWCVGLKGTTTHTHTHTHVI
jgi:hypothetical protein